MKKTLKVLLSLAAMMLFAVSAYAQVTTSALAGRVIDDSNAPVAGAVVSVTHVPTGTQYYTVANAEGYYSIKGMRAGGPYEIKFESLGLQPVVVKDVDLALGETLEQGVTMKVAAELLDAVVVSASATRFAGEKTGPVTNISSKDIANLPTISRSITDITRLSPYSNGMNIAGSDGRSSNFTVDGANFNNNFGLSENLPGGGNPISMDAIQEVQVVVAPFDVRQTNFIGGGVNAITKSGTNEFKGTAYTYHYNEKLHGHNAAGTQATVPDNYGHHVYGATLGGPIIKNKLFFFVSGEYTFEPSTMNSWRGSEDGVSDSKQYISRTKISDLQAVSDYLMSTYGYDAGSYTSYPGDEKNIKLLARIDWNINDNHKLAFRYNYTLNKSWMPTNASSSNCGSRASKGRLSDSGMAYSNACYSMDNRVHSFSLDLNSRISDNIHNQLLATYSDIADIRGTNSSEFPFIDILDGTSDSKGTILPYISAGYELFTYNNGVYNRVLNIKDDLTMNFGSHNVLVGLSYEHQMANNAYMRNGTGYYRYKSLEDFYNQAAPESVCLTYGYNGNANPAAQVTFNQFGLYAQDDWQISRNFKLNYGVRFDLLAFNNKDVMTNNAILALDYGGKHVDTGKWPANKVMISPRVGFVWDVLGDKMLKLRGGVGLFTGRLPLVFFTNMPTNSNMIQNVSAVTTTWTGNYGEADPLLEQLAGPIITDKAELLNKLNSLDPNAFPKEIDPSKGVIGSEVDGVDPNFRMPMVAKVSLGADWQIPVDFPLTVSAEGTYTKTIYGIRLSNWNIKTAESDNWDRMPGADNRILYPSNYKYQKTDAYMLTNTNQGYGYTANFMVKAQPWRWLDVMASYTRTESKELTGMPGSAASSAYLNLYTVNTPEFATLQRSQYVIPDRVIASVAFNHNFFRLPGFDTHLSIMYEGRSSGGYSFLYDNDVNRDGQPYDLIYIPNTPDELKWASTADAMNFWKFVNSNSYLRSHKGQYAEAYAARAPWVHQIDLRFAQDFGVKIGKKMNKLQASLDLVNLGNLINSNWGIPYTLASHSGQILHCTNVNEVSATTAPIFKFSSPTNDSYIKSGSFYNCWQIQLGVRYIFN